MTYRENNPVKIRFSHNYEKLKNINVKNGDKVTLIEALKIEIADLSSAFRRYDSCYRTFRDYQDRDNFFPLAKNGRFLLLIFMTEDGKIFTTIRRETDTKHIYYKGMIGRILKVIIEI